MLHYDLGYFDDKTCSLEPINNPFGPKLLPCLRNKPSRMCPEWTEAGWLGREEPKRCHRKVPMAQGKPCN